MPKRPLSPASHDRRDGLFPAGEPPAPPSPDTPLPLLGNLTPSQFMRRHWQKKPLLIRQAIPDVRSPLSREALFELAGDEDAEARLVTHFRQRWRLSHGPFPAGSLPGIRQRAWTLLVQGVDLHDERARALLERFRFVPDARLDDLMISYATDGGGVGPHFDSYDVFLLQVHGKRRWRIGAQRDLSLRTDLPLKVLAHFEPDEEWLLEPGDMLYLPPHIAHDGVAEGECMTCSIGFRAPSSGELASQFLYYLAERATPAGSESETPYRDPQQPAVAHPARLPEEMIERVGAILAQIHWRRDDVAGFLGAYLSEPKPHVVFDPPGRPLSETRFVQAAVREGIRLDRKTILLYDERSYFINGEENRLAKDRKWLPELADQRRLQGKRFVTLAHDSSVTALLHGWYRAGWIRIGAQA